MTDQLTARWNTFLETIQIYCIKPLTIIGSLTESSCMHQHRFSTIESRKESVRRAYCQWCGQDERADNEEERDIRRKTHCCFSGWVGLMKVSAGKLGLLYVKQIFFWECVHRLLT